MFARNIDSDDDGANEADDEDEENKKKNLEDKFPAEERPHKKGKIEKLVESSVEKVTVFNKLSEKAKEEKKTSEDQPP